MRSPPTVRWVTSGPTPEPVLGRQPSAIRGDDAAAGDDLPVYTPYVPLLRARWIFCAGVAVCCLLPGVIMRHVPAPTAIAMWTFSVAGLVGLWWSHRWFRAHASDAEPQPLDVVELSWLRRIRYPLLVIAGLLAVAAPASLRPGLGITAAVAAAGAGANLAAAVTAARWQRRSTHRLLAPVGRRMFVGRHSLRADARRKAIAQPHRRSPWWRCC